MLDLKKLLIIILFFASLCYAQLPDITKKYRAGEVGDSLLVSIIKFDTTATMFQRGDSLYIYSPALGDTLALESLFVGTGNNSWYLATPLLGLPNFEALDSLFIDDSDYITPYRVSGGAGEGDAYLVFYPDTTGVTGLATLAKLKTVTDSLYVVNPDTLWSIDPDTVQKAFVRRYTLNGTDIDWKSSVIDTFGIAPDTTINITINISGNVHTFNWSVDTNAVIATHDSVAKSFINPSTTWNPIGIQYHSSVSGNHYLTGYDNGSSFIIRPSDAAAGTGTTALKFHTEGSFYGPGFEFYPVNSATNAGKVFIVGGYYDAAPPAGAGIYFRWKPGNSTTHDVVTINGDGFIANSPANFDSLVTMDSSLVVTDDVVANSSDTLYSFRSIGITKGAVTKKPVSDSYDDEFILELGHGLIHYNITSTNDTAGVEIDSTKYATLKALQDSTGVLKDAYVDSAIQMINFFAGYTNDGILDTDLTDEWYFNNSIGNTIDAFLQNPDRSDGSDYADHLVFRVQVPKDYVAQDTLRIVLRGFLYVVLPSITRQTIITRVHEENQDGRGVSNISYTDSVTFASGSTYADNANYEIKVNGTNIVAGDILKVHLNSRIVATGIAVYHVLYNAWMYYRQRKY